MSHEPEHSLQGLQAELKPHLTPLTGDLSTDKLKAAQCSDHRGSQASWPSSQASLFTRTAAKVAPHKAIRQ